MNLEEFDCYACGKTITYPQWRFGSPVCSKCAEKGDKVFKGRLEW